MEVKQHTNVAHTQSHKHTTARPWKQLGQSAFCHRHKVLHTCMHIMCTCWNVSRAYLLWRLQVRKQNSLHGTHTVALTWSHKHSCKAMEAAWPISFLTQTQSLTHMHAHHVHMQECKQSILLPQRQRTCTCKHIQDVGLWCNPTTVSGLWSCTITCLCSWGVDLRRSPSNSPSSPSSLVRVCDLKLL